MTLFQAGSRNTFKSFVTVTDTDLERMSCAFDIALYQTNVVAVRKLCATPLKITRNLELELKYVSVWEHIVKHMASYTILV